MNRILDTLIPTALLALVVATSAQAQPPHFAGLLDSADSNKDGAISREELAAVDVFALLDRNSDGKIDLFDLGPAFRMRADGGFLLHLADEDKDGKLTKADWQFFLSKADANSDGQLSYNELMAFLPPPPAPPEAPAAPAVPDAPRAPHHVHGIAPVMPNMPVPPMPPGPPANLSIEDLVGNFDRFDANQDGELSGDELPNRMWHPRHYGAPGSGSEASKSDG